MARFSITTLGCKVNQYDGACLAQTLAEAGLQLAGPGLSHGEHATPDLVVINTCCVTATAMRKSRQRIRRAVRAAPDAAVIVAGCYSDYDARRIATLLDSLGVGPERTLVAGHHADLADQVRRFCRTPGNRRSCDEPNATHPRDVAACPGRNDECMSAGPNVRGASLPDPTSIKARRKTVVNQNFAPPPAAPLTRFPDRRRAFVKVQDGCDAFCSYCIVPYTRPRVRSRSIEQITDECGALVAAGHKEIVLCGVFLGAFGRATAVRKQWGPEPSRLPDLLRQVAEIPGLWRVRLSSLEPGDVGDELLAVARDVPTVAPHFHLPLQSGSAEILRRMNRQYTPDQFRRTVDRIRRALDRPALTADVIVGFPGETDRDFADTLAMAARAGFAKIHAFPFSPIEPTAAWTRRDEAPSPDVTKARLGALAELETRLAADYRRQFLGETVQALVERARPRSGGARQALTDRYLTVFFPDNRPRPRPPLAGGIVSLQVHDLHDDGLVADLVP